MKHRLVFLLAIAVLLVGVYLWPRYFSPRARAMREDLTRLNRMSAYCHEMPEGTGTQLAARQQCLSHVMWLQDSLRHRYPEYEDAINRREDAHTF